MPIKILTDTGADLPKEYIEKYEIDKLPLVVTKEDKEYLDGVDITPKQLYDGMRNGISYKTAQISLNNFITKFTEYGENKNSVIYICFSSGLSGTYETSLLAKQTVLEQYPDLDLEIIDSRAATGGQGLIVEKAGRLVKEGKTKEEIIKVINFYVENMEHLFTVDDMEYLYRGGRISKSTAFVGGLLNIKPVLEVNNEGKLVALDKVRGKQKALKRMLDIMEERAQDTNLKTQTIGICHGDSLEEAEKFKKMIEDRFGTQRFIIDFVGCAIGAHTGPGIITLFFLRKNME